MPSYRYTAVQAQYPRGGGREEISHVPALCSFGLCKCASCQAVRMLDSLISQPNDDARCFERILKKFQESPVVTVVPKYKPYYESDLYKRVYF